MKFYSLKIGRFNHYLEIHSIQVETSVTYNLACVLHCILLWIALHLLQLYIFLQTEI
jgi:hypothetical protein